MHLFCDEPYAITENAQLLDIGRLQSKRLLTRCGPFFLKSLLNLLDFKRNLR